MLTAFTALITANQNAGHDLDIWDTGQGIKKKSCTVPHKAGHLVKRTNFDGTKKVVLSHGSLLITQTAARKCQKQNSQQSIQQSGCSPIQTLTVLFTRRFFHNFLSVTAN